MPPKKESKEQLAARVAAIVSRLKKCYPEARTALHFRNPLEILVATILSAQCTDKRVNEVTKSLFARYKTARDYAGASEKEFQQEIRSTGFFRNKTRNIIAAAKCIVKDFGGQVPDTMEQLIRLPGVARKTANVVLGSAFGETEGVVVDTHVKRLSGRLGWTRHADPVKIERDLMELIPHTQWNLTGHLLIFHGRNVCIARKPKCAICAVNDLCPSAFKV